MSLFKTRELWSAKCDSDLFDLGCLKVANIGTNGKSNNSIITGSYNGFLRVYNPSSEGFKAHDLIAEISFPSPIIQIEVGRFVNTTSKQHIAVLMPKKLAVYEAIAINENNIDHGNQYQLKFIYEHVFQRNAYSMCKGSFGGVNFSSSSEPHEYICVQSMDGMLSVYEYESFSLSCFLPKVLLPGPFKYVPRTDSFITVSSAWELESYRYQNLATSAKTYERQQESNNVKLKRILPEYTYNLGEAALDIEVVDQSASGQNSCSILILGERNLYCFSETCTLKFMKKFELNPSCFCAYPILSNNRSNAGGSINYIVGTHSKVLLVNEDVKVKWAAQMDNVPVQMVVAKVNDTNGMIVTLSEDGQLRCSYLGTEPAFSNPIGKEDSKPFNFQTAEAEYKSLQNKIKTSIMNTGTVIKTMTKSGLNVNVEVPGQLDKSQRIDTELKDPIDAIPAITCKILLNSAQTCNNVKLHINCSLPIVAVPNSMCYSSIGGVQYVQEVQFYMKSKHLPSSLDVNVCASYSYSENGSSKLSQTKFRLPLKLIMKAGQQTMDQESSDTNKSNKVPNLRKLVLETNRPCANLSEIFPEFAGSYVSANGNTLAAQYYGHPTFNVSIQGSKAGNRYRFQSENLESMWLIAQEFVIRLNSFFTKQSQDVTITYHDPLPIEDLKLTIDKHLELRQSTEALSQNLEQCCVQFRAVQKRLLTKFKDKSPTSLDNMDALLEATFRQIATLSDKSIVAKKELSVASNSLNCMSSLFVLLLSLVYKFSKENCEILDSVLTTQVADTADLGWEEMVNAAVSNLLRNALSKSSKDAVSLQQQISMKLPADSNKLEKQFKSLVSKLENGATLLTSFYKKNDSNQESTGHGRAHKNVANKVTENWREDNSMTVNAPDFSSDNIEKHQRAVSREMDRVQERFGSNAKPFGSIKLPTFEDVEKGNEKRPYRYEEDE